MAWITRGGWLSQLSLQHAMYAWHPVWVPWHNRVWGTLWSPIPCWPFLLNCKPCLSPCALTRRGALQLSCPGPLRDGIPLMGKGVSILALTAVGRPYSFPTAGYDWRKCPRWYCDVFLGQGSVFLYIEHHFFPVRRALSPLWSYRFLWSGDFIMCKLLIREMGPALT